MATPKDSPIKVQLHAFKAILGWRGGWHLNGLQSFCVHNHSSKNSALLCAQKDFLKYRANNEGSGPE